MKFAYALIFLALASCAVPRDTSRVPYMQRSPTAWRTTPAGHRRDAGPFESVTRGILSEADLDQAVDAGYDRFRELFPDLAPQLKEHSVTLNDDYAMWVPGTDIFTSGAERTGSDVIGVCIWTRGEASTPAPDDAFIRRPPGVYFEMNYTGWRWTTRPLCPAIPHELLHSVIGDAGHKDGRWKLLQ